MEIVWCSLSTTYKVLDWKSAELERQKQYRPKILIENVRNILHQIPKTDINIVELQSYKSASRNPSVFPQILHKRLTEAVIHALSPVQTYSFDPNVVKRHFSLPKSLNKQYYSMTVVNDLLQEAIKDSFIQDYEDDDINVDGHDGLEGARDVVHSILSESNDQSSSASSNNQVSKQLQMPEKLIDYFHNQKQKDCLSDSLLQALTFLQLDILDRR